MNNVPSVRFMKKSKTLGKEPRRMTKSIIEALTQGSANPELEILIAPTANVGTGAGDALGGADFADTVTPAAVCKYINVRLQLGNKSGTGDQGWYEYAIILKDEQTATPVIGTDFSTWNLSTIAELAINLNRGKCIWNGAVPLNDGQAKVLDLKLKIPDKWCKWKRGQYLVLVHGARGADSTTTDIITVVLTTQWKCYL